MKCTHEGVEIQLDPDGFWRWFSPVLGISCASALWQAMLRIEVENEAFNVR